jgi:hypothetical protein
VSYDIVSREIVVQGPGAGRAKSVGVFDGCGRAMGYARGSGREARWNAARAAIGGYLLRCNFSGQGYERKVLVWK